MKIVTTLNDGRYYWREADLGVDKYWVEVPESTIALWKEIDRLDQVVNDQLLQIDNAIYNAERDAEEAEAAEKEIEEAKDGAAMLVKEL